LCANTEVIDGKNVRSGQSEHQKHLRRPRAHAAQAHQLRHDVLIGEGFQPI
jgi:hypothetical protein